LALPRYLWTELTGEEEVVTAQDSGLHVYSSFFRDLSVPVQSNYVMESHWKIIRYDTDIETIDPMNGHGTHACGTAASSILDSDRIQK
jgi:hypothetical protein